jgi:hypothetical protein
MAEPGISRRQLAGAATAAVLAPALPAAQDKPKEKEPEAKPAEASANALLEIVKLRYGTQLDEARLKAARQSLLSGLETAGRLRKVRLSQAEEPAFVFRADLP